MLLLDRLVPIASTPVGTSLQNTFDATRGRLAFDRPPTLSGLTPKVSKTKQVECLTPWPTARWRRGASKVDQPGLLWVHGQSKTVQALGQYVQCPSRIVFVFEHDDEVVGVLCDLSWTSNRLPGQSPNRPIERA